MRDHRQCSEERLRLALEYISEARGRFSIDPHEHAVNTVEDMQDVARQALAGTWEPDEVWLEERTQLRRRALPSKEAQR